MIIPACYNNEPIGLMARTLKASKTATDNNVGHKYELSPSQVDKIKAVLEKGDRIELIPGKDGIKIIQESRKEVK